MSIIHDALKKVQQGKAMAEGAPKKPESPDGAASIYEKPARSHNEVANDPIVEYLPSKKTDSPLAVIAAIAITLAVVGFVFKQLQPSLPALKKKVRIQYYKLMHKKDPHQHFDFPTKDPKDFVPLAKIPVAPAPQPAATAGSQPSMAVKPNLPRTLNIHGVMAGASGNVALINDQVYQEGDEVDGIKIVKIDLSEITVIDNGTEEKIRVKN